MPCSRASAAAARGEPNSCPGSGERLHRVPDAVREVLRLAPFGLARLALPRVLERRLHAAHGALVLLRELRDLTRGAVELLVRAGRRGKIALPRSAPPLAALASTSMAASGRGAERRRRSAEPGSEVQGGELGVREVPGVARAPHAARVAVRHAAEVAPEPREHLEAGRAAVDRVERGAETREAVLAVVRFARDARRERGLLRDVSETLRDLGRVPVAERPEPDVHGEHSGLERVLRGLGLRRGPELVELAFEEGAEPTRHRGPRVRRREHGGRLLDELREARLAFLRTLARGLLGGPGAPLSRSTSSSRRPRTAAKRSASGCPTSGGMTTIFSLGLHFGPSSGSLSFASTVMEMGRNMRRKELVARGDDVAAALDLRLAVEATEHAALLASPGPHHQIHLTEPVIVASDPPHVDPLDLRELHRLRRPLELDGRHGVRHHLDLERVLVVDPHLAEPRSDAQRTRCRAPCSEPRLRPSRRP